MDTGQTEGALRQAEQELQELLVEVLKGPGLRLVRLFQEVADAGVDSIKLSLTFKPHATLQAVLSMGTPDA